MQASQPFRAATSAASLGEIGGKKTGVVRDDDFRPAAPSFAREPLAQIFRQPLSGAADAVVIHRVRPDAGILRPPEIVRRAAFRLGHDLADGAPANAAGPESERLDKSDRSARVHSPASINSAIDCAAMGEDRFLERAPNVGRARPEQLFRRHCALDCRRLLHPATFPQRSFFASYRARPNDEGDACARVSWPGHSPRPGEGWDRAWPTLTEARSTTVLPLRPQLLRPVEMFPAPRGAGPPAAPGGSFTIPSSHRDNQAWRRFCSRPENPDAPCASSRSSPAG